VGVEAASLEDVGVDHAGATDFVPARLAKLAFAGGAGDFIGDGAGAAADLAGKVDFERGFGELEVKGAEATFGAGAVKFDGEMVENAFEVGDGDVFIDDEAFELVEHLGVSGVLLAAVAAGNVDHPDGGAVKAVHLVELTVGSVGGEDEGGG
jgi:hypothetical protein